MDNPTREKSEILTKIHQKDEKSDENKEKRPRKEEII